jgi:hypothetical protein
MRTIRRTILDALIHPEFKAAVIEYMSVDNKEEAKDLTIILYSMYAHMLEVTLRNVGNEAAKAIKRKANMSDIKKMIVNFDLPNNITYKLGKQQKPTITISPLGLIKDCNYEAATRFGYHPNEIINKMNIAMLIDHDNLDEVVFSNDKVGELEVNTIDKYDTERQFKITSSKNTDEQGNVISANIYFSDDTLSLVKAIEEQEECKVVHIRRKKSAKNDDSQLSLWGEPVAVAQ